METSNSNPFDSQQQATTSTPRSLHNNEAIGWAEQYDEHGQPYYFNIQTQETKWDIPDVENDGGYWKQLWDDVQNSLFYQHTLSGQMRWTLRDENEPNSDNEFSSPEITSASRTRQTYENSHPPQQQLQFDNGSHVPYNSGVKINDLEAEEVEEGSAEVENISIVNSNNTNEISNAINTAFASSVIAEGLSKTDDNVEVINDTVHNDNNTNPEKMIIKESEDQDENMILNNNTLDSSTSSVENVTSSSGEEKMIENNSKLETSLPSSDDSSSSDGEEDEDDDDTVFYVYQCLFLFHGCAVESPAGVIEAALRIVLHICLATFYIIVAVLKCFSDIAMDRIKFHLKECMLYLAAATSLICCIPGCFVYRDFNTFKDDFDLLPIYTICGRVDPRRFWVFTKGQGAEALNVVSKKYPEDSMDDYQYNHKKSKYKKFGRKSSKKKRRSKHSKKKSRSKNKKHSSTGRNVSIEMSNVIPSGEYTHSAKVAGKSKYDDDDEEDVELFSSDDEMVQHQHYEIEMV
eukprot:g3798.t1